MNSFEKIETFERGCYIATERYLSSSSEKMQSAYTTWEQLFELLYRFSCCFWGCHGKSHVLEYLAGRSISSILSSRSLLYRGYYDECLALIRNLGETANLLNLFWVDPPAIKRWHDFDERRRRDH